MKQFSKISVVMALLPCVFYSNVVLSDCAEEIPKLKAAANAYKTAIKGRATLPAQIKSKMRERYKQPFEGTSPKFKKQECWEGEDLTKKDYVELWKRTCRDYQELISDQIKWLNSSSDINKDTFNKYRAWNQAWASTKSNCIGWTYKDKDYAEKLKRVGIVPSEQD